MLITRRHHLMLSCLACGPYWSLPPDILTLVEVPPALNQGWPVWLGHLYGGSGSVWRHHSFLFGVLERSWGLRPTAQECTILDTDPPAPLEPSDVAEMANIWLCLHETPWRGMPDGSPLNSWHPKHQKEKIHPRWWMPSFVLLGFPAPWAFQLSLSSSQTGQWSHQNWAKAPCFQHAKTGSGWLYPRDAMLSLAPNHASPKSVQPTDCSSGLSGLSTPAVPAAATSPFSCTLWYPDGSRRSSKGGFSQAAPRPMMCLIKQKAQQTQPIWRAHQGSAQASHKTPAGFILSPAKWVFCVDSKGCSMML